MNDSPCLGENEWHCFEKTGESVMEKRREEKKKWKLKGTWEMIGAGLIGFSLRRNRATGGMRRTCGLI